MNAIENLAGRDDLTKSETITLRDARRAKAPTKEHFQRGKWTVEISSETDRVAWHASVWLAGTGGYAGERCLAAQCATREEAMSRVDAFFANAANVAAIEKRHGV